MKINGKEFAYGTNQIISYEKVVELAEMKGTPSMTHSWRERGRRMGENLSPGTTAAVQTDSVFNVAHTGNS